VDLFLEAWNHWSVNPHADFEHSRELALKALALDDANESALRRLSNIDLIQGRLDQAVADAERAVALNPNFAGGYEQLSNALNAANRPDAALRAGERGARLAPVRENYFAYARPALDSPPACPARTAVCRPDRGEDTKGNLKNVKDRRHDTLCSAIALDDG
jgi:tetratricopeptide (TPR) repeat protein